MKTTKTQRNVVKNMRNRTNDRSRVLSVLDGISLRFREDSLV